MRLVPSYDVTRLEPLSQPFLVRADAWFLGDLVVTSGVLAPVRLVRSREKIRADRNDLLAFFLLRITQNLRDHERSLFLARESAARAESAVAIARS